jgi:hypothetical protein
MNKYKIEFVSTETYIVDVEAKTEHDAIALAHTQFDAGNYQEVGDNSIELGGVYNVTGTDDPFNP